MAANLYCYFDNIIFNILDCNATLLMLLFILAHHINQACCKGHNSLNCIVVNRFCVEALWVILGELDMFSCLINDALYGLVVPANIDWPL